MHKRFDDLVLRYSAGSLDEDEQAQVEQHLSECEVCRRALDEWRLIAVAARAVAEDQAVTLPPLTEEFQKERETMNYIPATNRPQRSLAMVFGVATLLALVSVVLIARPSSFTLSVLQPGPAGYVEVVLAAQPIEGGSVISAEEVMLYDLPEDVIPFSAVVALDDVIGKIARTSIPCGQPVLTNMLTDNARDVFEVMADSPVVSDCETLDLSPLQEPVAMEAIVVAVQELPAGILVPEEAVMLRPYPAQLVPATALRHVEDVIQRSTGGHILREQAVLVSMMGQVIPPGTVAVSIPLQNIQSDLSVFQPGAQVDVIVGMHFVSIDDDFQTLETTENMPEPRRMIQRIANNAQILTIGDNGGFMMLAVSSDEASVLVWAGEAGLPILIAQISSG